MVAFLHSKIIKSKRLFITPVLALFFLFGAKNVFAQSSLDTSYISSIDFNSIKIIIWQILAGILAALIVISLFFRKSKWGRLGRGTKLLEKSKKR